MRKTTLGVMCVVLALAATTWADDFGTGVNQFTIDFVTISGDTNPTGGIPLGDEDSFFTFTFVGVNNDYRIGSYEITNDQWAKFTASLGTPLTGDPATTYDDAPSLTGPSMPTNNVSWREAAQFVNWLNTSAGHHAAYNFTGTQGTGDYALTTWSTAEADNGTNLYRHKDAFYYLPTEDEWVKAAYWNGTDVQTYATKAGEDMHRGDGVSGTGWNYSDHDALLFSPAWGVGSGSEELNGTYDMMGNLWEHIESPLMPDDYGTDLIHPFVLCGGMHIDGEDGLASSGRTSLSADGESTSIGFRVASAVPEPATMSLLAVGGGALLKRRKK